ncbi:MarR family transcriptional regulator, partial [Nocardioides massiliensis]
PASVTSAVTRLEAQGFVTRTRGEEDRRLVLAAITPAGREVVEKATVGLNETVFAQPGLAAAEVDALTAALTRLRAAAGDPVN